MANTRAIKTYVEPYVRLWLESQFPGHSFNEQAVPLLRKSDGTYAEHRFDAVSEDATIVATIKSSGWWTSGRKRPAGKIGEVYQALYMLSIAQAAEKNLVLTDREFYDRFARVSEGKVASEVRILLCPLPQDIENRVRAVRAAASGEMNHAQAGPQS